MLIRWMRESGKRLLMLWAEQAESAAWCDPRRNGAHAAAIGGQIDNDAAA